MRQQQQLLQQQQQRQALLAQQAFQSNMQGGMTGVPMGLQLNAQQMQQMHHMRQQASRLGPVSSLSQR
jgi:surface antigen